MKNCTVCGGTCKDLGNGSYRCNFCRAMFTESDFAPAVAPARSTRVAASRESDEGVNVFDKNVNGVLEISTATGKGSGYLITRDGYGITNSHVVSLKDGKSCGQCTVKVADEQISARVVAMGTERNSEHCTNSDLALIKLAHVPHGATPLKFGDYSKVRTGERIFVIGNSLGYGTCITSGIISDNNRQGQLMYDCATNPGNSGGPVFNAEGLVIGTHVAGLQPNGVKVQGMNFAIPCNAVQDFLRKCGVRIL